ncbi:MAG: nucleotidyltransferase family protein [Nitrospinota bacterium]
MKSLEEIKIIIARHKKSVEKEYHVKEIGIFGSYVRGEQDVDSDIDILVEFKDAIGFFKFIDLEEYFESILKLKVDLVSRGALKPIIGKYILDEVEMI